MEKPFMIGVSGGSGSGKSHFCKDFVKRYEASDILLISSDSYFKKELPKMTSPLTQQEYDDWNSPESLEYTRLLEDVKQAAKQAVKVISW